MKALCPIGIFFLWFMVRLSAALPDVPDDQQGAQRWLNRRILEIEQISTKPNHEALPKLGEMIRQLGVLDYRDCEEKEEVMKKLRIYITEIPGHAEWFGKEIKAMTDNKINRTGLQFEGGRGWYFQTLSQLPSPETVKVLGEQLFDERSPFEGPLNEAEWKPSCYFAAAALHNLGLENPPVKTSYADYRNDLRTWQLWFEQVRAGTRTFSFKGDKTIYSLAGPVAAALDPANGQSESPQPVPDLAGASPGSSNLSVWIALSFAVVALILAAKFAFAKKPA
ncbi:hypothetical protein OKA05_24055 [Luteolibacter arcticus]|uniref:Uncharacterized protein n=1 Tax=Luteolibacter arcticus TaxID=1581411 RepID=A0ABT3GQ57_9BACT|nr:hypothetical protein [Luteolibacter arcticus]MCW1925654.1 hypothetical protein [Luteolibacter arcticus]